MSHKIIVIDKEEKEYLDKSQYDDKYDKIQYDDEYDKIQYDDEYIVVKDYVDFKNEDTLVAVSPDGSIVATFNSDSSRITITNVAINKKAKISFDRKKLSDDNVNFLGWSLAVSDIIDNNIVFVAISCITEEDMNPKEVNEFRMADDDIEQFKLSWISSKGTIQLYKFELNDSTNLSDAQISPIHKSKLGGVIGFLKTSKTSKNNVTLVCTNYIGIHKINIRLSGKNVKSVVSYLLPGIIYKIIIRLSGKKVESSYLLPEILYKKLKNVKDATHNLEYLSKSRYQEFLMVDVNNHQAVQNIEIYDINTLQLVNVFYKYQDSLITKNNKPGIFAISTDSRLLAYSYGNNTIAIYLMENGLEVVLKKFDNIFKIKFLKFIKDEKLFIIEKKREGGEKLHVWVISGCLNDYFSSPIPLYSSFALLKHEYNSVIFLKVEDDDDKSQFKNLCEKLIKMPTSFGDKDFVTEYKKCIPDMEPWIENTYTPDTEPWTRGFLNNDKKFLLIIGQKSIQLWKSKSQNFKDSEDFKSFENSDLVYIFISKTSFKSRPKFQIKNDMTTVIIDACKSLAYLYTLNNTNFEDKCQKYVSGITNIIRDFIKKYPNNWKLMEVQYPLMAYLIISRSFSLIKCILFGDNSQKKNAKNFNNLKLGKLDLNKLKLNDLKLDNSKSALKFKILELSKKKLNDLNLEDLNLEDLKKLNYLDLIDSELASKLNNLKINDLKISNLNLNDSELASKLNNLKLILNGLKSTGLNLNSLNLNNLEDLNLIDPELALKLNNLNLNNLKLNDFNLVDLNLDRKLNILKLKLDKLELNDFNLNRLNDLNIIDSELYSELKDLKLKDLNLNNSKLNDLYLSLKLKSLKLNYLELALKLDQDQDAVILTYLLEYYSENAKDHIGWMNNVKEIFPKLPENYSELLFYKPCFGGVKFNFLNKRFKTSYDSLKFKVHLPVTRLIEAKSASFLQYETTHDSKDEDKRIIRIIKKSFRLLLRLLLLRGYSYKESSQFFSFLQKNQHKGNREYFNAPIVEAFITSKWLQARNHWGIRLMFYTTFLFLFSFLSQLFLSDNDYQNKHNATFMTVVGIFYYVGTFVLLGHPSLLDLIPSAPTYTLDNGTTNFTLTGEIPENPFNTIWDAILSAYYWNTIDFSDYDYWPLKLFAFIANVILVLVLLNMIIALMNDAFTKAKEDGTDGLLLFRTDLIHDYESTHFSELHNGPLYICFHQDSDLIKYWKEASRVEPKLYEWFKESMDEEIKFYDKNIEDWYKLISGTPYNKYRDISENDIWFLMKESIKFDDEKH
ncbi:19694_t:CDS:2 [Rhizophagus irregularis]|nr:19694_t:CDS:2 [Rhizophagus irregularis]